MKFWNLNTENGPIPYIADFNLINLPFPVLSLAKFVDDQNENEFFGTGRVGVGDSFEVVPSIRGALKSEHQVPAVHHGDVLVVVECSVESVGSEVSENQVISDKRERERERERVRR
jgi:hypothetical protein